MFRFYLDNNLVSNPINWSDFTETIEWDDSIKGILPKYDLKLTFAQGGWDYLYNLKIASGYCNMVEFKVEKSCNDGSFSTILQGFISISRCIFHYKDCTVECDIIDNNYGAMIYNNKSIKTSFSDESKNGVTIASPNIELLVPFNPSTGTYSSTTAARYTISVYEAFKYLVAFMSDGAIGFESNFLSNPDNNGVIASGEELRLNTEVYPITSFEDLFKEVDKKQNIGFTVITVAGSPVLKIENIDYFYSTASGIVIDNIPDLRESFNPEKLYSGIKLGGTIAQFDPLIHNFIPRQFIGFDKEEYFFKGTCNIDKALDLECDYICDTNIIEELIYTNTTNNAYDKDIFLINGYESGGYYYATKTLLTSGGYQYNKIFTNEYSSQAFNVYGDTVLYTGLISNNFQAERTNYDETNPTGANFPHAPTGYADVTHNDLVPTYLTTTVFQIYNDDSTPPNVNSGGNYNNANGRYTAPLDGGYFFEMYTLIRIFSEFEVLGTQGIPRFTRFTITLNQYDSSNVLKNTFSTVYPNTVGITLSDMESRYSGYYGFTNDYYIECVAGDYVVTSVTVESVANSFGDWLWCNITNSSSFKTTATPSGGGVFQKGDDGTYFVSKLEFENPISQESYDTIKADVTKSLSISHNANNFKTGWIRKSVRNLETGDMTFELISNKNNT